MGIEQHMRPKDIQAFRETAKLYKVYILVRRTNRASVRYMGAAGYVPKRIDCKAKTADLDILVPGIGPKEVAGLVVDPTLDGFGAAFATPQKYAGALREWTKFAKLLPTAAVTAPGSGYTYIPEGGVYAVQLDPAHKHYGCVLFSAFSLISAGKFIHGDYDLYDIVPANNPTRTGAFKSEMLGQSHHRDRDLFDVQHALNRRMGMAAVLHGSQAQFAAEHSDEPVDVFFPDGVTVKEIANRAALEALYAGEFGGRKLLLAS